MTISLSAETHTEELYYQIIPLQFDKTKFIIEINNKKSLNFNKLYYIYILLKII